MTAAALAGVLVWWFTADSESPASGRLFGLAIVLGGLIGRDTGHRFVVPFGIAVLGYWSAADAALYTTFYSTSAQVIPVLILVAVVEQRDALRRAARTGRQLALFLMTVLYMLCGEVAALYAAGRCDPAGICSGRLEWLEEGLASYVACGLAGGFASMLAAALLPAPRARP